MEVLFMDTGYNTTRIVDAFTSLIWTDRYIGYGEFELRLPMQDNSLAGIRIGYYASIKESPRYMIVERIDITTSFEDGNIVLISGRSLESILDRRIVRNEVMFSGDVCDLITRLINENAANPDDSKRQFTRMTSKDAPSNVRGNQIDIDIDRGEILYNVIESICDVYKIGFRMMPDLDTQGGMIFELYKGEDRTYAQEKNPWIVFSPQFENIKDTDMDMDTTNLRTTVITDCELTVRVTENNDSSGNAGETNETVETFELQIGADKSDLNRRELFNTISKNTIEIKKDQFGNKYSMVNKRDYCTWEPIYFDSQGYQKAYDEWSERYHDFWQNKPGEKTTNEFIWYKPGDPEYKEEYANYINIPGLNGYWEKTTTPAPTAEEYISQNQWYYNALSNSEPNKDDFMEYGWVLTKETEYYAALNEAQAKIDKMVEEAIADSRKTIEDQLQQEAAEKLAPYTKISTFDGEIDPNVQFKFGEDYYLGDLVQIVNAFHFQAVTRVSAMTFTEEEGAGVVNYPTFVSDDKAVFEL